MIDEAAIKSLSQAKLASYVLGLCYKWKTWEEMEQDCNLIVSTRVERAEKSKAKSSLQVATNDFTAIKKAIREDGLMVVLKPGEIVRDVPKKIKGSKLEKEKIPTDLIREAKWEGRTILTHACYGFLRLPTKQEDVRMGDIRKRYNDTNRYQRKTESKPIDFEGFYETAKAWLDSEDPIEAGIAVMILTGRRPGEVFGHAQFKPLDENRMWARGLLKKPDSQEVLPGCYIIPCFYDSEAIVSAIEGIRKKCSPSDWEGKDFNESNVYKDLYSAYNADFRESFAAHGHETDALRNFRRLFEAVVSVLCQHQFPDLQPLTYAKNALSHESAATTEHYDVMKIESVPDEIQLPEPGEIGDRGEDPVGSPFSNKFPGDLGEIYKKIALFLQESGETRLLTIQRRISERLQQGDDENTAIAFAFASLGGGIPIVKALGKHEKKRDEVSMIIDAMMEHNKEARENGYSDPIGISFTSVQRILLAWKQRRLGASVWKKAGEPRIEEIRQHHYDYVGVVKSVKPEDESKQLKQITEKLGAAKIEAITELIVNRLNG